MISEPSSVDCLALESTIADTVIFKYLLSQLTTGDVSVDNEQSAQERKPHLQVQLDQMRAEVKLRDETIKRLNCELEKCTVENKTLKSELEELRSNRDVMIDKVERLHAEKYKLEDKIKQMASFTQTNTCNSTPS